MMFQIFSDIIIESKKLWSWINRSKYKYVDKLLLKIEVIDQTTNWYDSKRFGRDTKSKIVMVEQREQLNKFVCGRKVFLIRISNFWM